MNQLELPGVPARDSDPTVFYRSFEDLGFVVVDGTDEDLARELDARGLTGRKNHRQRKDRA